MGRYRGKREAQPAGKTPARQEELRAPETEVQAAQAESPDMEDPFREEGESKPWAGILEKLGTFFASKKGKIIVGVVCALAVLLGGTAAFLRSWIRQPTLPSQPEQTQQQPIRPTQPSDTDAPMEPEGPTDDELYPDDGYSGEMPAVSGERKEGMYTFLLVGTDKDDGNTDTIMVASYDTVNQTVSIMSIPRDTMTNEWWDLKKINSIYSRTGRSIDSLKTRVRKLVGFTPDFYVKVDLSMFVELVDLVEGVEFYVPQDMKYTDPYQDLYIDLKEGTQVLDGEKAMQLVRFRGYSEGDIKRVEVQQNFVKALIKECLDFSHWGKIKAYIDLALENVETDLEFRSVVWFAANVLGLNGVPALDMDDVYTCTIPGNYWATAWSRATQQEQSYVTIYPRQVVELVNERFNPYLQNVTTGMLDAMSILENGDIASSTGSLKDQEHNAIMAVRRGEAYYDEEGNIVYGTPPVTPEVDEAGNYYILDEAGNIVYTDENGVPLEEGTSTTGQETDPAVSGTEPPGTTTPGTQPPDTDGTQTPGTQAPGGTDTPGTQPPDTDNPGAEEPSGTDTPSGGGGDGEEPTLPEEPELPPAEEVPPGDGTPPADGEEDPEEDTGAPGWL